MTHATGVAGPVGKVFYERRLKESHVDTVMYEIDMLNFCFSKLPPGRNCKAPEEYLLLEGFLLHYRNLLSVFSGKHLSYGDELGIAEFAKWGGKKLEPKTSDAIIAMTEAPDNKYFQNISRYLQHCTTYRYQDTMSWDVTSMKDEIDPVINAFVQAAHE
jgi:hypothetical protein